MDSTKYDAAITQAEHERAVLYSEMERIVTEYSKAAVTFSQSQSQERVQEAVTRMPEITQRLGIEKLGQLKMELKAIIDRAPSVVPELIDKPEIWEHRSNPVESLKKDLSWHLKSRNGHAANDQLRLAIGDVGELLVKYGFADLDKDSAWERKGTSLRYKYWLPPSDEINEVISRYKDVFEKYVDAHLRVVEAKRAKEQAIATDLWNQA